MSETHPSFGMITAHRVTSTPGKSLFDSEIRHSQSVTITISTAERGRDLNRDWIHPRRELIEVAMSEAQWASFVSSMNTSGVPCTLARVHNEDIEAPPFAPRLEHSMAETRQAAHRAFSEILEALETWDALPATPKKAKDEALATLRSKIKNARPNVDFAGRSLMEHAENVVQKARADVESMILRHAQTIGLPPADLPQIGRGDE